MSFTESQQTAIENTDPNNLVVAGAGSGKTRVLTHRVARLVSSGVSPQSILVLTFTRKAARELKERLSALVGDVARKIWVGTFHGISYRILAQWGDRIGYKTDGASISIVSPEESAELIDRVCQSYGWKGSKRAIDEARSLLAHNGTFPPDPDLGRIIREYWSILKENNALDYDQILLETHRLFEECPDALEFFRNKFVHVFVDEYQDTDRLQYDLHERISPENLFVVGDVRQAIYGWRGADISIILGFDRSRNARITHLAECFRCGRSIVEAANRLIAKNGGELEKPMIPALDTDGEILVRRGGGDQIVDLLNELFEPHSTMAVIARTHHALDLVEDALRRAKIDYLRVGAASRKIEDSVEWKTFHGALRSVLNPRDSIAFLAHAVKVEGLSADQLSALRVDATNAGMSLSEFYYSEAMAPFGNTPSCRGVLAWLCGEVRAFVGTVRGLWERFYLKTGLYVSNPAVCGKISDYLADRAEGMTPVEWLEWLGTRDMHADLEAPTDRLTLLTAHAAKGLEWNTVIIADFDDGVFPSQRAIKSGDLDEERRLAYVTFTRAKKRLAVFSRKEPSRFMAEAGVQ